MANLNRINHSETLLGSGLVLVCGGLMDGGVTATVALYDPATGVTKAAKSMRFARQSHQAILLASGLVLVVGGEGLNGFERVCELYDPTNDVWATADSINFGRKNHRLVKLNTSNDILIVGGSNDRGPVAETETYVISLSKIVVSPPMVVPVALHTATLLNDNTVLVAGGVGKAGLPVADCQLFDPSTGLWGITGAMKDARKEHVAVLTTTGKVLVSGGEGKNSVLKSAELYSSGSWTGVQDMNQARKLHAGLKTAEGAVMVAGGLSEQGNALASLETFSYTTSSWVPGGSLASPRYGHQLALITSTNTIIATGGQNNVGFASLEAVSPAKAGIVGAITTSIRHSQGDSVRLSNGKVILVSGNTSGTTVNATCEIYNPAGNTVVATGSLATARRLPRVALLQNGKVIAAGGIDGTSTYLASTEIWDPAGNSGAGSWSATGDLTEAKLYLSVITLNNGKVLAAGGQHTDQTVSAVAELFDPAGNAGAGSWSATGSLATARRNTNLSLLANGKVLAAGGGTGATGVTPTATCEIFDPAGNAGAGSWSAAASMHVARAFFGSCILPNGKVFVFGGEIDSGNTRDNTGEIYDPAGDTWTQTSAAPEHMENNFVAPIGTNAVMVAGGFSTELNDYSSKVWIYDIGTDTWVQSTSLSTSHGANPCCDMQHQCFVLSDGSVLITVNNSASSLIGVDRWFPPNWL